ncbi:MAG TPA: hypothetical protein VG474_12725 [Solirubrobacteraceae bacterium]|nr:hypothetical protein [Solirubrobacteraceae bacterium]
MDFRHPARSQRDRTRRENRHLNFYKRRDNLPAADRAANAHEVEVEVDGGTSAVSRTNGSWD